MGRKTDNAQGTRGAASEQLGVVVTRYGAQCDVETSSGSVMQCAVRRRAGVVVCGDRVRWSADSHGGGVIEAVEPRQSLLERPDFRGRLKPMAANVDTMVVVVNGATLANKKAPGTGAANAENVAVLAYANLVDSYLVAAEAAGMAPVLVLNKTDLLDALQVQELTSETRPYQALSYPVIFTSVARVTGLEQLTLALRHRTAVFIGQSGAGKSSLIAALVPGAQIATGEVSDSGLGKHTTTTTRLYHLPAGGRLIDSPGIREFNLGHLRPEQIRDNFVEFRSYHCNFKDCLHRGEPGCAVDKAARGGAIDPRRLQSYRSLV